MMLIDEECAKCEKDCLNKELPIYPVTYIRKRYDATQYAILYFLHKELGMGFKERYGIEFEEITIPVASINQKSQDWEYEKEWRVVCIDPCKEFYALKADAVIIGARAAMGS